MTMTIPSIQLGKTLRRGVGRGWVKNYTVTKRVTTQLTFGRFYSKNSIHSMCTRKAVPTTTAQGSVATFCEQFTP